METISFKKWEKKPLPSKQKISQKTVSKIYKKQRIDLKQKKYQKKER